MSSLSLLSTYGLRITDYMLRGGNVSIVIREARDENSRLITRFFVTLSVVLEVKLTTASSW